jgi:ketosteroid isomerase-like protein
MKKLSFILLASVILVTACKTKTEPVTVNTEAAKASITEVFEKYNTALKAKDVGVISALLSEDALCCGTDPGEFWDKKAMIDLWNNMAADTSVKVEFTLDKREIRLAKDGNSAIVIEQFVMPSLCPRIPVRSVYHVVKSADNWMFDLITWNLIPKNEDLGKLNKALE